MNKKSEWVVDHTLRSHPLLQLPFLATSHFLD